MYEMMLAARTSHSVNYGELAIGVLVAISGSVLALNVRGCAEVATDFLGDKPHEPLVVTGTDPAEAVTPYPCLPIAVPLSVTERLCVERVYGGIVEDTAPLIRDRHRPQS